MKTFQVGDSVVAVTRIWRRDGCSQLLPGESAKVVGVYQSAPDKPQLVDLEIPDKPPMINIVISDPSPLRLVFRESS